MSESEAPKSSGETKKGGCFTSAFWLVFAVLFGFTLVGNAVYFSAALYGWARSHDLPFIGRLAKAPAHPPYHPEFGYVLEPVPFARNDINLFRLARKWAHGGIVGAASPSTTVNILFVERDRSHWLFQGRNRNVLSLEFLSGPLVEHEPAVTAVAMVVAEKDTNGNGDIGPGDQVSLYVYRMDGKAAEKLMTADRIRLVGAFGTPMLRVIRQTGTKATVATYAVPSFKLEAEAPVADLPRLATEMPPAYDEAED